MNTAITALFGGLRGIVAIGLLAMLGACATWETTPADGPYYESYGYPDNYGGPGYYGPGYYQPGYYGGYWYGGGYYTPSSGGSYAQYPYYPGTHVIIVDHNGDRNHPNPPQSNRPHEGDIRRAPHDPVNPVPQSQGPSQGSGRGPGNGPEHPFGIPDRAYNGSQQPTQGGSTRIDPRYGPRGDTNSGGSHWQGQRPPQPPSQQRPPPQSTQIYRQGNPGQGAPRQTPPPAPRPPAQGGRGEARGVIER